MMSLKSRIFVTSLSIIHFGALTEPCIPVRQLYSEDRTVDYCPKLSWLEFHDRQLSADETIELLFSEIERGHDECEHLVFWRIGAHQMFSEIDDERTDRILESIRKWRCGDTEATSIPAVEKSLTRAIKNARKDNFSVDPLIEESIDSGNLDLLCLAIGASADSEGIRNACLQEYAFGSLSIESFRAKTYLENHLRDNGYAMMLISIHHLRMRNIEEAMSYLYKASAASSFERIKPRHYINRIFSSDSFLSEYDQEKYELGGIPLTIIIADAVLMEREWQVSFKPSHLLLEYVEDETVSSDEYYRCVFCIAARMMLEKYCTVPEFLEAAQLFSSITRRHQWSDNETKVLHKHMQEATDLFAKEIDRKLSRGERFSMAIAGVDVRKKEREFLQDIVERSGLKAGQVDAALKVTGRCENSVHEP